jgi:K+-transporting ATPase KdpF subunit
MRSQGMPWINVLAGLVAAGLLLYLIAALLKPEWF